MSKEKKEKSLKIPSGHVMYDHGISQEQLRVILNNELVGIVNEAGLEVPVETMKPIPQEKIPETRLKQHKNIYTKKSIRVRIAMLIVFVIINIFVLQNTTAYAVANPVDRIKLLDDYSTVIKILGEPQVSSDEVDYNCIQYYNVDFIDISGCLTIYFSSDRKVNDCVWEGTIDNTDAAADIFEAMSINCTKIYGECYYGSEDMYVWDLDSKQLVLEIYENNITIYKYILTYGGTDD